MTPCCLSFEDRLFMFQRQDIRYNSRRLLKYSGGNKIPWLFECFCLFVSFMFRNLSVGMVRQREGSHFNETVLLDHYDTKIGFLLSSHSKYVCCSDTCFATVTNTKCIFLAYDYHMVINRFFPMSANK